MRSSGSLRNTEAPTTSAAGEALPILIVDDEPPMRRMLAAELDSLGYATKAAGRVEEARRELERTPVALIITDLMLPDGNGLDVLACAHVCQPGVPVLLLSGRGTIDDAVAAMKLGATDFLQKPMDPQRLATVVARALDRRAAADAATRSGLGIVGDSPALTALLAKVRQIGATDTTVLIQGESGTGKELVARALHEGSRRRGKSFVAVDCGALEPNLLASELFGHVRGAFTGADASRQGLFQAAHGGTLFLDEIGNMSLELQARLLRVLQERRVRPLGGDAEKEIDVRVIAATNADLRAAALAGSFRQDLYYRLAVVTLEVPPLRERAPDIAPLVRHFAERVARRMGRPAVAFSPQAMARLETYPWPGNVRELANVVERAVILAQGEVVGALDLPDLAPTPRLDVEPLDDAMRRAEESAIRRALRMSASKAEAARRLGISRRALYDKMERLAIDGAQDE